jgi:hypothetical protein
MGKRSGVGLDIRRTTVSVGGRPDSNDTRHRNAARKAYRARIESLLDQSGSKPLADVWHRVCPLPIGFGYEPPDRRGMIKDLADFAEALRPDLGGMKAHGLCKLVEKYAAWERRPAAEPK